MKLTFLHTAKSHVARFDKIVEQVDPQVKTVHYVKENLLEVAQKTGKPDQARFTEIIQEIREKETGIIICTCSTYGDLCKKQKNTYRIDQPVAEYLVGHFTTIAIAFTLNSTKKTSKQLLEKVAQENKCVVQIKEIDCSAAWTWFEQRKLEKYEATIARIIQESSEEFAVVLLAQASMEGAQLHLQHENYLVVSSPEIGIRKYLKTTVHPHKR